MRTLTIQMQLLRIVLLVAIVVMLFVMAEFPSIYFSRCMYPALRNYKETKSESAPKELLIAQQIFKRNTLFVESGLSVILVSTIFLFIRAGRKQRK